MIYILSGSTIYEYNLDGLIYTPANTPVNFTDEDPKYWININKFLLRII